MRNPDEQERRDKLIELLFELSHVYEKKIRNLLITEKIIKIRRKNIDQERSVRNQKDHRKGRVYI